MKNSIVKAFINVSFWTFVSRVFGFIRDVFLAASIGAGPISDAFFVAFKLPNMFRRLTAEGALVQSFLPTFTFIEEQKSKEKGGRVYLKKSPEFKEEYEIRFEKSVNDYEKYLEDLNQIFIN